MSGSGTFETCPPILRMYVHRGRPEVAVVRPNRRERPCADIREGAARIGGCHQVRSRPRSHEGADFRVRPAQLVPSLTDTCPERCAGAGQSSKVRRGRLLPPAFPLTFRSGELFVWRGAGSGCTLFPSPHDIVAVIGDENAGRAPANPRTDGAAYVRASPFHTNYFP